MLAVPLLVLLGTLLAVLALLVKRRHSYWRRRGVFGPPPSFPFGHCTLSCLGRRTAAEDFATIYRQHKGRPYVGVYFMHTPVLQLHDLDIIKDVFIKEFPDFNGRGTHSDVDKEPLTGSVFLLSGQAWRNLRVKLSPTFSSGKIKYYFSRVEECARNLQTYATRRADSNGGTFQDDIRDLIARYSTDIIASVLFGLESNCIDHPDAEFRRMGRVAFEPSFMAGLRANFSFFARDLMQRLPIKSHSPQTIEFFCRIVQENVGYREQNKVDRADLLNLLIQLKNKGFVKPDSTDDSSEVTQEGANLQKMTMGQIIAQIFVFYIAGFETSSSTTSFALYELAKAPHVLEKLLEEVDETMAKHAGKITYESISNMPYMEKVINETLRLYPAVPFLTREVMRARTLPRTDLQLEKGTLLEVPVSAIHRDPDLWPDPDTFDPERFSDTSFHPMAHMPFGAGPRYCIGARLGKVQVKAALTALLSEFRVSCCATTPVNLSYHPSLIVLSPVGSIHLNVHRRKTKSTP